MSWLGELWRSPAENWIFGALDEVTGSELVPDTQYVSVTLRECRISDVRVGRQRLFGTITSSCSVLRRGDGRAESLVVTTPGVLRDVDPDNLDKVVTGATRLLGPVPYRGQGIDVEIGLFAMPGQDLLGPYLNLLEQATNLAGVGLIGRNSGLVGLVKDGMNVLLGGSGGPQLEIGVAHTFDHPKPGTYAVIRVAKAHADAMPALDVNRGLCWKDGSPVTEPYIVFSIDAETRRDDWPGIPLLGDLYEQLRGMAERGDLTGSREVLAAFRRAAVFSADLLTADGERLYELVRKQIELAFPSTATGSQGVAESTVLPQFSTLDPFES